MLGAMNTKPVTIAQVRSLGVTQLIVFCRGKCEGEWLCPALPIERFQAIETNCLQMAQSRCQTGLQQTIAAAHWRGLDDADELKAVFNPANGPVDPSTKNENNGR